MIRETARSAPQGIGDWRFALLVVAAFLAVAGWGVAHHEMWRDEMQAWLVARDSATPFQLLHNTRYEGHPLLWFVLLWPLAHAVGDPVSMQYLNLLFAAGTALLAARFAPGPRWLRALAVFGYFAVYEYGTIARNYAVGLLPLAAFCSLFPRRREHPLWLGTSLFLVAESSLPACILALAATVALAGEMVVAKPRQAGDRARWGGVAIALAGVALSAAQMVPPADSGYAPGWNLRVSGHDLAAVLQTVTTAYLPLPRAGAVFWESSLLRELPGFSGWAWLGAPVFLGIAAVALVRRPVALLYFLCGSLGLLAFFYLKALGYLRHHGFLFVSLLTALWIAPSLPAARLPPRVEAIARWGHMALRVVVPILLVAHITGAAIAVASDQALAFSGAQATAALLRSRGLDRLPLVINRDYTGTGILGYLHRDAAWYPAGSRYGSFVVWDTARYVVHNVWGDGVRLAARVASPVVLVLDEETIRQQAMPAELRIATTPVGCREGAVVTEESFCAFLLDPHRVPEPVKQAIGISGD